MLQLAQHIFAEGRAERREHAEKVEMLREEAVRLDNTIQVRQPRAQSLKCLSLTDPPIAASACSTTLKFSAVRAICVRGARDLSAKDATVQMHFTV